MAGVQCDHGNFAMFLFWVAFFYHCIVDTTRCEVFSGLKGFCLFGALFKGRVLGAILPAYFESSGRPLIGSVRMFTHILDTPCTRGVIV